MPTTRRHRPLVAVLTAAACVVLMSACGGGADTDSPAGGDAPGPDGALAAFQSCLAENGVTLPSADPSRRAGGDRPSGAPTARPSGFPTARPSGAPDGWPSGAPDGSGGPGRGAFGGQGRPAGVDDETWQKAQDACSSLRPTGGPGMPGAGRPGDAGPAGDGNTAAYRNCLNDRGVALDQIDPSDAAATAALEACRVLSPSPTS
ncbi:hypothetical protein C1I95_29660 [Micromonospora craterilacus]|uniref:PT repeat-containing protein n=1 Tax=Micromonospora craterilacus TaxID=1655439 RepID=A0A2W2E5I0_9ACTN|nr:hypothetical protein [Micromonospora craterilacus]PZG08820.1 hypothetical protein C1I95_29660 [Micromonospora craterilacus]